MGPGNAAFIAVFCLFTVCEATRNPILSAPQGLPNLGKEPQHHLRHPRHGTHGPTETAAAVPHHQGSSHSASHKSHTAHAFHAEKEATGSQGPPSLNPYYTGMPSDAKEQIGFADGLGALDEPKKEDEKKEEEEKEEKKKPEDSDAVREPEHADAEGENEHSGKPGGGGKPMVPREHEHGDTEHAHEWSYEDHKAWKDGYAACGGKAQSPVDITGNISKGEEMEKLQVSYVPLEGLHLDNNGHNVQVNGKFGNLTLKGGTYQALQLHFHFPSEHKVDGKLASGEMHIVHQKFGSNGTKDLAVISVLLNTEYANTEIYPPEIEFMMQLGFDVPVAPVEEPAPVAAAPGAAPAPSAPAASPPAAPAAPEPVSELPKEGTSRPAEGAVDIGKVFEKELSGGYYHYEGSLTTPPCSETVQWFVLDQRAPITQHMVNNFKELFPNPTNNRPVQPLNGREIEWSDDEVSTTTTTPVPVAKDGAHGGQAYLWLFGLVLAVSVNA